MISLTAGIWSSITISRRDLSGKSLSRLNLVATCLLHLIKLEDKSYVENDIIALDQLEDKGYFAIDKMDLFVSIIRYSRYLIGDKYLILTANRFSYFLCSLCIQVPFLYDIFFMVNRRLKDIPAFKMMKPFTKLYEQFKN